MKATKLITLGVLIGTCSFAAAQDAKPPQRPQRQMPPEMLKKFDTDGDGKLSESEMTAMQAEMKAMREKREAELIAKYDKDGDGKLSPEERQAVRADMEAKRKALIEKYDANKNGKLDPEEVKTAREAGEELPMMDRRGGQGGRGGPGAPGGRQGGRGGKPPGDAPAPAPAPAAE